jgi:hypothetical protein
MTKMQKIWMWIFIAMFAAPEILWGDLIKLARIPLLPIFRNFQFFNDNPNFAYLVIVVEMVGILGVIYLLNKDHLGLKLNIRYIINVILFIILVALVLSLGFSYIISQISFP